MALEGLGASARWCQSGADSPGRAFGYQSEPDSGLQLLGHRYYDPSAGRFLSRDKAKDGRNWYGYCGNSPLTSADPTGEFVWFIVGAVVVAAVLTSGCRGVRAFPRRAPKVAPPNSGLPKRGPGHNQRADYGRRYHEQWQPKPGYVIEYVLPSGKKVDALNEKTLHIIELITTTANRAAKRRQVEGYIRVLNQVKPGPKPWTYSFETYVNPY
ncbi:MAG: hypothetical protein HONBIEJF_02871 [Fimbriimonadaceae bacterium]|nr:hypothetical protein [Fimbriimonadaceae bacterium]